MQDIQAERIQQHKHDTSDSALYGAASIESYEQTRKNLSSLNDAYREAFFTEIEKSDWSEAERSYFRSSVILSLPEMFEEAIFLADNTLNIMKGDL